MFMDKHGPGDGMSMEEIAFPKMKEILFENGLQVTLKILIDSLDLWLEQRGPNVFGCQIVESLRGIHAGYLRRHEEEEADENALYEARVEIKKLKAQIKDLNSELAADKYGWK